MAQPLYFLPHVNRAQLETVGVMRQVLKERGLTEIFADCPQEQIGRSGLSASGPGGLSGTILCYTSPHTDIPTRSNYQPQFQQWTPIGDGSQVWIGIDTEYPPTPEDLARRKQYDGYRLTLADGNEWLIPIVRRCHNESTNLPTDLLWDATGKLIEPIKPAYEQLWKDAAEVVTWFVEEQAPRREDTLRHAVQALGINYRYGPSEHAVIRAIDSDCIGAVLQVVVDYPRFVAIRESQKKMNEPSDTPSSTPGSTDETLDTAPAVAS